MIEKKISHFREHFTQLIISKRPHTNERDVDELFKRNANTEVNQILKELGKKKEAHDLSATLSKTLNMNKPTPIADKLAAGSKQLLTNRLTNSQYN